MKEYIELFAALLHTVKAMSEIPTHKLIILLVALLLGLLIINPDIITALKQ